MSERLVGTIDTNIILRHVLQDQPDHSPRASAMLGAVRTGSIEVYCPDTAIFETVYILSGRAKVPRNEIAELLTTLVAPSSYRLDHKDSVIKALEFWAEQPALDFADCYHLALTAEMGLSHIYTFDKKMDRYPGVARVEP